MGWQPINTAPRNGTPIWAYLFDSGIRKVRWWTAAEIAAEEDSVNIELLNPGWYEVSDPEEGWNPQLWLPESEIPDPTQGPGDAR